MTALDVVLPVGGGTGAVVVNEDVLLQLLLEPQLDLGLLDRGLLKLLLESQLELGLLDLKVLDVVEEVATEQLQLVLPQSLVLDGAVHDVGMSQVVRGDAVHQPSAGRHPGRVRREAKLMGGFLLPPRHRHGPAAEQKLCGVSHEEKKQALLFFREVARFQ
jgi:hypothetical protein